MSAVLPPVAGTGPGRGESRATMARPGVEPLPVSAADRLTASRARLRAALMEIAHPPAKASLLDELGLGTFKSLIADRVKSWPGAALVIETLEHWWAEHPLHTAGVLAEEASRRLVGPIARKNPYAVVIGSVVVGALFALSRPWRWLLRPALFVGLVPQLASQALKRMPIDSWLQMLSSFTATRRAAAPSATAAPDPASHLPRDS